MKTTTTTSSSMLIFINKLLLMAEKWNYCYVEARSTSTTVMTVMTTTTDCEFCMQNCVVFSLTAQMRLLFCINDWVYVNGNDHGCGEFISFLFLEQGDSKYFHLNLAGSSLWLQWKFALRHIAVYLHKYAGTRKNTFNSCRITWTVRVFTCRILKIMYIHHLIPYCCLFLCYGQIIAICFN